MTESTDIVRLPPEAAAQLQPVSTATIGEDEFNRLWRIGLNLAKSGMFKDISQGEQAFAKILLGRDLGLSPAQSLGAIYFVKGNLQIASVTLASFVKRHTRYDYRIAAHDADHCVIEFYELQPDGARDLLGASSFDRADAQQAGLLGGDNWKKHPRNMFFARAMSNGVKFFCPDLLGGVPVYTEGDSFDRTTDLTAIEGGQDTHVDLAPDVEQVVQRATRLGHATYSDRAAAAMATVGQSDAMNTAWVARAMGVLDHVEAEQQPEEAEVVDPISLKREPDAEFVNVTFTREPLADDASSLTDRLAELDASIMQADADGDDTLVAELVAERDLLRAEAAAQANPDQDTMP